MMDFKRDLSVKRLVKILNMKRFFPLLAPGHGSTHGWCNAGCELKADPTTGQMLWPENHFQDVSKMAEEYA